MLTAERVTSNVGIENGKSTAQSHAAERRRFAPLVAHWRTRVAIGAALAAVTPIVAARILATPEPGLPVILAFLIVAWLPASFLTDK